MELGLRLEVNATNHILSSSDFLMLFNTCGSTSKRNGEKWGFLDGCRSSLCPLRLQRMI